MTMHEHHGHQHHGSHAIRGSSSCVPAPMAMCCAALAFVLGALVAIVCTEKCGGMGTHRPWKHHHMMGMHGPHGHHHHGDGPACTCQHGETKPEWAAEPDPQDE